MTATLIRNARIRTMDPARPGAEAMLIAGGRIVALGDGAALADRGGPGCRVIDAGGRLVLPGFQDAHVHLLGGGTDLATAAQLHDVADLAELVARMAAHSAASPDLPLVIGTGWQAGLFGDDTLDAALLDRAVPDRPAIAYDSSFHSACLNSAALALAGIGADTADPPNGRIVRQRGRASGMLHEDAVTWAAGRLPQLEDRHLLAGLRAGQAHANRHGITGILEPKVTGTEARIYAAAARDGWLSLRVAGAALVTEADTPETALARLCALRSLHHGPDFHVQSAKLFMDGVFENRTAALLADYADPAGGNAGPMFSAAQVRRLFTALDAARFQIHVHVIGDAAARRAIEGLEAALAANGAWPGLHQLAHLQLLAPGDCARIAALGAMANIQPLWTLPDPAVPDPAPVMAGPDRAAGIYAFRRMIDAGAGWCLSSDWPVSTLDPFAIIAAAVTRPPAGLPGARALSVGEAVLGYTVNAAAACWRAGDTGMLRPGFSADLVVLDRDILACPADEIAGTCVLLTLFRGAEVHRDPAFDA